MCRSHVILFSVVSKCWNFATFSNDSLAIRFTVLYPCSSPYGMVMFGLHFPLPSHSRCSIYGLAVKHSVSFLKFTLLSERLDIPSWGHCARLVHIRKHSILHILQYAGHFQFHFLFLGIVDLPHPWPPLHSGGKGRRYTKLLSAQMSQIIAVKHQFP